VHEGLKRQFVSEPITPEPGTGSIGAMSSGEPGLPRSFTWRDRRYEIASVASSWKGFGEDRGDTYVRRHWYEVLTACGVRMRLYFDRNAGRSGSKRGRWWLYWVEGAAEA
jgi:hypothetical protein